jgi:ADP-dependent NAD(P)H-hydrate dehydratase / NAD(P)H-hydrate epimerase
VIRVVSVEAMRHIEAAADAGGLTYSMMMENAGRAAAQRALEMLTGLAEPRVAILVGSGNNGGDGLVAGRYIAERDDVQVHFYLLKRREEDDPNFKAVQDADLFIAYAEDDHDQRVLRNLVASADLVIDALFGIGIRLPIKGKAGRVLRATNQVLKSRREEQPEERTVYPTRPDLDARLPAPRVLAIDCPSGLDCDSGQLDTNAIQADETITFIAAKPGLFRFPGAAAVGALSVASIGVSGELPELQKIEHMLADGGSIGQLLPDRPVDGHKGTYGKVMVIAGSVNYSGAPALAAEAAYRAGAGLVTVGAPGQVVAALSAKLTEPTWLILPHDMGVLSEQAVPLIMEQVSDYQALLLGPGWNQEETTGNLLRQLLETSRKTIKPRNRRGIGFLTDSAQDKAPEETAVTLPPLVIDADGLNLLARIGEWWKLLPEGTIITPHPGEMSRLAGMETGEIRNDPWKVAIEKARAWNLILVLKGAHTLITTPDGQLTVLPFKTDALSTAGTGDILAGLIAGMLAQGLQPYEAAVAGGYVHGLAGELAARDFGSGRGVVAGDLFQRIPAALDLIDRG